MTSHLDFFPDSVFCRRRSSLEHDPLSNSPLLVTIILSPSAALRKPLDALPAPMQRLRSSNVSWFRAVVSDAVSGQASLPDTS